MKARGILRPTAFLLIASASLLLASCSKRAAFETSPQNEKVFQARGVVRSHSDDTITVQHEDIPGLMPAMTMPFEAKNRADIAGVHAGDAVQFQLHTAGEKWWISNVEKISDAQLKLAPPERSAEAIPAAAITRLKVGNNLPDFALVDQNKQPLTRESFRGKILLLTFVFTRCPMPNFCPLISQHFSDIEKALRADATLAQRVQLLSITLDPTFDTPEILAQYGEHLSADPKLWRFGTGQPDEVKKLTSAFSVYVQPEGGTISHGLCTALIGPDGVIRKIWRGNGWTTDEALREVRSL
jgi:protein SCO1/2